MNPHRRKLLCRNADRRNSANYDSTIYNFGDVAFDDLSFLGCHFRRSGYLSLYVYLYIYIYMKSERGRWLPIKVIKGNSAIFVSAILCRWSLFRRYSFRRSFVSMISVSARVSAISVFGDLVFGDEAHNLSAAFFILPKSNDVFTKISFTENESFYSILFCLCIISLTLWLEKKMNILFHALSLYCK
jgi:hypothetical protein